MPVRLSRSEFIEKSMSVHGSTYSYEKSDYTGWDKKLTITCNSHGDFMQTPRNHIYKRRGCQVCGGTSQLTHDDFIKKCKEVYGDSYDFSKAKYVNNRSKIKVVCNIHGEFIKIAGPLMLGNGCQKCSRLARDSAARVGVKEFKRRAEKIHGGKYNYDLVKFKNMSDLAEINCPKHGPFHQTPKNHLKGRGCSACRATGFNKHIDGQVYLLVSDCNTFVKIGISNNYKNRISILHRNTPFNISLFSFFESDGVMAAAIEKFLHKRLVSAGFSGFDGATEWFYADSTIYSIFKCFGATIDTIQSQKER